MIRALVLVAAFVLAGCASLPADRCAAARQAVRWAQFALPLACAKQSRTCDTAGLVLKAANTAASAVCPTVR